MLDAGFNTKAPFFLLFALRHAWRAEAIPSGRLQKIPARRDALLRQCGPKQYPLNPKNPLHPDETSLGG
jgi:hypothetical protein